jgi:hypothetical protein
MATSLDNLANASIQKNATIDNLVATNAAFTKAIQDIQRTLATMMTAQPPNTSLRSPRPTYRRNPPRLPIPLGDSETTLGQNRVLLVPRL